jgi:hypothetical protein
MSDDFIRGLQDDLVQAMERYELRAPRRRFAARMRPRWLRPARLVAVAAAAAILVVMVVAARNLAPEPPPPARPHVMAVLPIGGIPTDGVLASGSLWANELAGSVVQVDPAGHRVIARINVRRSTGPITADADSVWVQTTGTKDLDCKGALVRIDPSSHRIASRRSVPYPVEGEGVGLLAAAGDGGVWVKRGCTWGKGVDRLDRAGAVTVRVALDSVDGLATAAGSLWVIGHDGTLTQIDAATGRIEKRWPKLAPLDNPETWGSKVLAADGAGVWVLSTGRAAILRVEGGRVVRQIPVGASALPLLVNAPDGLWVASGDRLGRDYRLTRFDPPTGTPTAMLKLGIQQPVALIPTGGQLCVLTAGGRIVFIGS